MLNLNRAQIIGNITKDPEMKYTPNGQAVTTFSVATNRRWKGRDGAADGEATEYHEVTIWGKQAEAVTPMLKKGGPVYVEGRLQTRSWEGQDGAKRYKTEIVAENVIVLGGKSAMGNDYEFAKNNDSSSPKEPAKKATKKTDSDEIDIEEIPF